MKKIMLAALMLPLSACGYASVEPGNQGVAMKYPWFFGTGGVVDEPLPPGSHITASSTDVINIDMTPRTFEIKFDDLAPSDGIPLDFQTTVRLQVTDAVDLVKNWNGAATNSDGNASLTWFWGSIEPQYQNYVRQAVKKYDMNTLALTGAAIDAVDQEVQTRLSAYIAQQKIPVKLLGITVGRATPPPQILNQRVQTAAQQQRVKTMIEAQKAEVARKESELARADADNAYNSKMQLNPAQYIELKRIEMQTEACKQGTCIFGNGTALVSK
jgi:hypothetical protein